MKSSEAVNEIRMQYYEELHDDTWAFRLKKQLPSEWVEENIYLSKEVSKFSGFFKYDKSPYSREIIDQLYSKNPSRVIAVMKGAQIGITQGVVIPGMLYVVAEDPAPMLFMAGNKDLAKNSVRTRFDPVLESSGLSDLIRSNVIRKRNSRTGDTDFSKEYAGGVLIVEGMQNADKLRQFSVKVVFGDDFDAAPLVDKKEGSIRKLIEGRQTSFGNIAKTFYISTPTTKQASNIEPVYLLGDQRLWHWECPHCLEWISLEWRTLMENGEKAGIMYKLDERNRLMKESVHYKCQNCGEKIHETQKYDLNLKGRWIPTATAAVENYVSYKINGLAIPPGFIGWPDLVKEWMEANPVGQPVDADKLKTFLNIRLGETWEEISETPKIHYLMNNMRDYVPGVIPDDLSEADGNGKIVLLTLACDLNGVMSEEVEDVRLDWELLAHTQTGVTYSVDQGSIGSFKRARDKSKLERERDWQRKKWTYKHGAENSVWPEFDNLINRAWPCESGQTKEVVITVVDTGYFTKLANLFIGSYADTDRMVLGVKGSAESEYRKLSKDTRVVRQSRESKDLFIVEVNQMKDEVAGNMRLQAGDDGYQPSGFMNYPKSIDGKYTLKGFFKDYEGEARTEEIDDGKIVGYKWAKVTSQSSNHFWDVRVYGYSARDIYLDLLRRSDPQLRTINWADFVHIMTQ